MKCDILVIGAGVLGLSSAYYIKKRDPSKEIIVIDKYSGPGQGNSAKSEGGFRNIFTSETNYLLSDTSIEAFKDLEEKGHDIKLEFIGYLWLFSQGQYESIRSAIESITDRGDTVKVYSKEELKQKIPCLVTDFEEDDEAELLGVESVAMGVYGEKCGGLDADALVRAYERMFLDLGGKIMYNTKANELLIKPEEELGLPGEPFVWQEKKITGAITDKGEIKADKTVIATGAWANELLDPAGIDSFQRPKKRQIFAFKDPKLDQLLEVKGFNKHDVIPLTILPKANILFRPELSEGSIWLACADEIGRKFELEEDPQPEEDYYTNDIYYVLVKYFPCFEDVRPMNMWAGQYAINSLDETPVIYESSGLYYIGAASGSGIMKADSLGRILDALVADEEEAELYGGRKFKVSDLGIKHRRVEHEEFV
ncbi:FAD-dependent oxidoreductase, partial [Candidatus Bathyarchaeota archaeon]|nr:FAD-dependent oxidoreductase [Candidatus Bathyarchaeota archaeon]